MAWLAQTKQALADGLMLAIPDLQVKPFYLEQPTPPCAYLWPAEPIEYDQAMHRGMDTWTFMLRLVLAYNADQGSQATLDAYLDPWGPRSIKAAIDGLKADATLAGLAYDVTVPRSSGYRWWTNDTSGPMIGSEWTLELRANGDPAGGI